MGLVVDFGNDCQNGKSTWWVISRKTAQSISVGILWDFSLIPAAKDSISGV